MLTSCAIGLRVVFLMAVTSRFVIDGTINASTATAAEGPTISPALATPVSPVGSMPEACT